MWTNGIISNGNVSANEKISRVKTQPEAWENHFSHSSERRLITRVYKELGGKAKNIGKGWDKKQNSAWQAQDSEFDTW